METQAVLLNLLLGLLLGMAGQVVRAVSGLRKLTAGVALPAPPAPAPIPVAPAAPAPVAAPTAAEAFSWTQFGISLILGGVAGMTAAIIVLGDGAKLSKEQIMGLIAAGYSGSDFLEGVIKWLPKTPAP